MPNPRRDPEILDLDDEEATSEELQAQVQKAQAELTELKRRTEQIERDKQRLEELKRRQDEFETGRAEMLDKLTRALSVVHRETEESQKRLEQLEAIQEAFEEHLRGLESINPKTWAGLDLAKELSKAVSALDNARSDFSKAQPRLTADSAEELAIDHGAEYEEYGPAEKGFGYWVTAGFGFTLPLMVLMVILSIFIWMTGSVPGR